MSRAIWRLASRHGASLGRAAVLAWTILPLTGPSLHADGATRLVIEPEKSEVGFLLSTTWHNVEGRTKAVAGTVTSKTGDLFAGGMVSVEVEAGKLETGNGMRDRKMREDCLETQKFPKIAFVSTAPPAIVSSSPDPAGGYREASLTVPGDLTIHGVKRGVILPVTLKRDGDGWTVTGKLPVKLSDYSIPDPSIILNRVKDEVTVTFAVRAKPAAAPSGN